MDGHCTKLGQTNQMSDCESGATNIRESVCRGSPVEGWPWEVYKTNYRGYTRPLDLSIVCADKADLEVR